MSDEKIEFIKNELKKKGYPLENYVQSLLYGKKWQVYPNAYFLDKDSKKGRELDIKAMYEHPDFKTRTSFFPRLLIQCKKIPGNAWIFFSTPSYSPINILHSGLTKWLDAFEHGIFSDTGSHNYQTFATNYCEIVTDKATSNRKENNIWESVITLIKASSQEIEKDFADSQQYLLETGSFEEFAKHPSEIIYVFYPVIVFEGDMYEAKFVDNTVILEQRDYVRLFVDYDSGHYKGQFCIDFLNKLKLVDYIDEIEKDMDILDKRRAEVSEKYESSLLDAVNKKYQEMKLFKPWAKYIDW